MSPEDRPVRGPIAWLFRNRQTGEITIGQFPNLPLFVFAAAAAAAWVLPSGRPAEIATLVSRLALAWWAADEILRGVNPWRRLLGSATLAWLAWSWLRT